jgi:DNA-binding CsgD family transcriptional regulator
MTRRRLEPDGYMNDRVAGILLGEQLAAVFDTLSEREAHVVTAHVGVGVPQAVIAKHLGLTTTSVRSIVRNAMSKLRHPSRSQVLRDYLGLERGFGWSRSDYVAGIARQYGLELVTCAYEHCPNRFLPKQSTRGGRPQRYCSPRCRTAASRARRR